VTWLGRGGCVHGVTADVGGFGGSDAGGTCGRSMVVPHVCGGAGAVAWVGC